MPSTTPARSCLPPRYRTRTTLILRHTTCTHFLLPHLPHYLRGHRLVRCSPGCLRSLPRQHTPWRLSAFHHSRRHGCCERPVRWRLQALYTTPRAAPLLLGFLPGRGMSARCASGLVLLRAAALLRHCTRTHLLTLHTHRPTHTLPCLSLPCLSPSLSISCSTHVSTSPNSHYSIPCVWACLGTAACKFLLTCLLPSFLPSLTPYA